MNKKQTHTNTNTDCTSIGKDRYCMEIEIRRNRKTTNGYVRKKGKKNQEKKKKNES